MGRAVINNDEWAHRLRTFERSAFRLELQPRYLEPEETSTLARFMANDPQDPTEVPMLRTWFRQIRDLTDRGRTVERVRVQDEPPTEYQRWERFISPWNLAAGETLRYLTRRHAYEVGLLPDAGKTDWWLLDNGFLMLMFFDDEGRRIRNELTDDQDMIRQACAWRDLAVQHSVLQRHEDALTA